MSPRSNIRRLFPALPRDYIRRRRAVRRITNISLITVLSLATAYSITRPTGGVGFRAPKQVVKPVSPAPPAPEPTAPAARPTPVSSLADASAYELANGLYSVSEVEDLVLHDPHRNKDLHVRIFYPNDSVPSGSLAVKDLLLFANDFSTLFQGESFRTIDPVTSALRH